MVLMLQILQGHTGAVTILSVDSSGKTLFSAGADATIFTWNIRTGQKLKVKTRPHLFVFLLALSYFLKLLLSN